MGAGSRPRWERDRDRDSGPKTPVPYTDISEIPTMCSGQSTPGVDNRLIQSLACTRFSTIHRPNYYYHWMNNKNDASSGGSE
jgi:hypothetical protein